VKKRKDNPAFVNVKSSCRGFTLPEVLIAVVILAVGIISVLEAFNVSLAALGAARDALRSSMLVIQKMTDIELSAVTSGRLEEDYSAGGFDGDNVGYRWDSKVIDVSSLSVPGLDSAMLNQIDLAVWREGASRRYSISTYLRIEKPKQ